VLSVLHTVLWQMSEQGTKVHLSTTVHEVLDDFRWLATDLARRPKRILEVATSLLPRTLGAQDADKAGMGGVHSVPLLDGTIESIMW
jgi:hypothetical protein